MITVSLYRERERERELKGEEEFNVLFNLLYFR